MSASTRRVPRPTSGPLPDGADAFPAPAPRRGHVDEMVHESLCYRVPDGSRPLFLDVHVPRTTEDGASPPLIVWIHGGGWISGSRRRFPVGLEQNHLLERALVAGFAIARIDYRLAGEAPWPAAVDDVDAATSWLIENAALLGIDASRVALWGESAGAHLAVLVTARRSARGEAAPGALVDWYGPVDLAEFFTQTSGEQVFEKPSDADPGADSDGESHSDSESDSGAGELSLPDPGVHLRAGGWNVPETNVIDAVHGAMPPTLVVHGRADSLVPPAHSERLATRLGELGVEARHVVTEGGHVFAGAEVTVEQIGVVCEFLGGALGFEPGPHPDRQLAAALAARPDLPADPLGTDDPVEARRRSAAFMSTMHHRGTYPVQNIADTTIEFGDRSLPLRVQRCARPTDTVLLYVHGGGWVVGDLDSHEVQSARLGASLPAHVVQVDYRLAPEHPFPAAYEDVLAALDWVRDHLAELGAERIVLAGDSAGGNLAISAALACPARGIDLAALVVNYPGVDLRPGHIDGLPATYLGGNPELGQDPRVSPILAADEALATLPPTVIGLGGLDFLFEDVLAFAYRVRRAGVPLRLRLFPSLGHGFFSSAPLSVAADRAAETICREASEILWDARSGPQLSPDVGGSSTVIA